MDLKLEEKFTPEELTEIRKRVFSFADQMFLEGISVGRELNKEEIYDTTEQFVRDKLSAMTSYFANDEMWKVMPPMGYNSDPNVDIPQPSGEMAEKFDKAVENAGKATTDFPEPVDNNDDTESCCPESEDMPMSENMMAPPPPPEKPEWVEQMEKDGKPPFPG